MAASSSQAKARGSRAMVQRMFSSQERSFADRKFFVDPLRKRGALRAGSCV
jgi:hypothetical protein